MKGLWALVCAAGTLAAWGGLKELQQAPCIGDGRPTVTDEADF